MQWKYLSYWKTGHQYSYKSFVINLYTFNLIYSSTKSFSKKNDIHIAYNQTVHSHKTLFFIPFCSKIQTFPLISFPVIFHPYFWNIPKRKLKQNLVISFCSRRSPLKGLPAKHLRLIFSPSKISSSEGPLEKNEIYNGRDCRNKADLGPKKIWVREPKRRWKIVNCRGGCLKRGREEEVAVWDKGGEEERLKQRGEGRAPETKERRKSVWNKGEKEDRLKQRGEGRAPETKERRKSVWNKGEKEDRLKQRREGRTTETKERKKSVWNEGEKEECLKQREKEERLKQRRDEERPKRKREGRASETKERRMGVWHKGEKEEHLKRRREGRASGTNEIRKSVWNKGEKDGRLTQRGEGRASETKGRRKRVWNKWEKEERLELRREKEVEGVVWN